MHIRIDIDTDRLLAFVGNALSSRRAKLLAAMVIGLTPLVVVAAVVTAPYTFTDGSNISAAQVNANFEKLFALVNDPLPRKLQRVVGQCNDGADSGYLACRKLTFTKKYDDTYVRFIWSDNRRGIGYIYGYWDVTWNRKDCTSPSPNRYWHHSIATSNYNDNHYNAAIAGVCKATSAGPMLKGTYDIEIRLTHQGGNNSDWYVGWNESTFMIEAEEVY